MTTTFKLTMRVIGPGREGYLLVESVRSENPGVVVLNCWIPSELPTQMVPFERRLPNSKIFVVIGGWEEIVRIEP